MERPARDIHPAIKVCLTGTSSSSTRTSSTRTPSITPDPAPVPYIPAKLPRSRSIRKSTASNDDLDSSCSLSVRSTSSFDVDIIPESITLAPPLSKRPSLENVKGLPSKSPSTKKNKSVKKNQKLSHKKATFGEVWATRGSGGRPKKENNNSGYPFNKLGNPVSNPGNPPPCSSTSRRIITSPTDSTSSAGHTPYPDDKPPSSSTRDTKETSPASSSSVHTTPITMHPQPSPISMRGSPFMDLCVKPIASRPNSGNDRGVPDHNNRFNGGVGDNNIPLNTSGAEGGGGGRGICILGAPTRPGGSETPQQIMTRNTPVTCPNAMVVPDQEARATSPSCIPDHLSAPSLIVENTMEPQNIEINFEVEPGYTFNALYTPHNRSPNNKSPRTVSSNTPSLNTPSPTQRTPSPSSNNHTVPLSPNQGHVLPADADKKSSNKLFRSASDRSQIKEVCTDFTRSQKRGSFMKIIKKAKGSKKGYGPVRSAPNSPSISQRSVSASSRGSESRYSLVSSRSPSSSHARHPSDEQNLIRIWADQIDGGVEGYKGFLISPDTTARELLSTVHTKLALPGTDKDFFLCAKFFESSIQDRPLIDTDRPLFLHQEWDTCESYRFEVRQKPKAIMMVFGDDALQYSRNSPFGRGAVEVSEDASTGRIISELVNKYQLDPCQRYHLMERRPNFDRILKSSDCPVLLQRRWIPFEDVKFVIGISPSTPDLFGQLSAPSQFSSKVLNSGVQTSHSMNSLASVFSQDSTSAQNNAVFEETDSQDYPPADLDTVSIGSIERALNLMSPEIDKPISDDTDNPEIVERQQIISSGFDAMQSCWMGIQDQEEPHSRVERSPGSDDLSGLEESLYNDLVSFTSTRPSESESFVKSEFFDSSGNSLKQSDITSDPLTSTSTTNNRRPADLTPTPCTPLPVPMSNLSSESCRVSFGTSNDTSDADSDGEPWLYIPAKSSMLGDSSFCSDSGVNVSEGSSYRPGDHDPSDSPEITVPVFQVSSPTTTESINEDPISCLSTPRKLSVANSYLHDMSWDNFDLDRENFATSDEYEEHLNFIRAQIHLKHTSGAEIIGDLACLSETDTLQVPSIDSSDGSNDLLLPEPIHIETSDKDNVYDSTDVSLQTEKNGSEDGLPLTESLSLLAETKLLYNALEHKTNMLEERYFSPEKMMSLLKDPLGSLVTETTPLNSPEQNSPSCSDPFCDPNPEKTLQNEITPPRSPTKSVKLKKNKRLFHKDDSLPNLYIGYENVDKLNGTLTDDDLCSYHSTPDPTSLYVEPGEEVKPGCPVKIIIEDSDCSEERKYEAYPKVLSDDVPLIRKFHSETFLSQISIETETTENSRNSVGTESTAILRESVERLKLEIEEIVDCCDESFSTSLDTDRHNFTDSTYENAINTSPRNSSNFSDKNISLNSYESNSVVLPKCSSSSGASSNENRGQIYENGSKQRYTIGVDVTYYSDLSDLEDIHYIECDVSDSLSNDDCHLLDICDISDSLDNLVDITLRAEPDYGFEGSAISLDVNAPALDSSDISLDLHASEEFSMNLLSGIEKTCPDDNNGDLSAGSESNTCSRINGQPEVQNGTYKLAENSPDECHGDKSDSRSSSCRSSIVDGLLELYSKSPDELKEHLQPSSPLHSSSTAHISDAPREHNLDLSITTDSDEIFFSCSPGSENFVDTQSYQTSYTPLNNYDSASIKSTNFEPKGRDKSLCLELKQNDNHTYPSPDSKQDTSYGAAYDNSDTSDSDTSGSEASDTETLSGKHRKLCRRLKRLNGCFETDRHGKIIDLECDAQSGKPVYEIKLPCISEESECDDTASEQINKSMPHADLKRQYKNLLAEIEETKPKLRQLEVLQSELTSMQKAYHDLKEQALRMSIEQDAQKSQIDDEIQKLKISNQDLMKKNKDNKSEAVVSTIMELEKLYSNRITALEKALQQKDGMVKDLEEQNKNMMTQLNVTRRQSVQLETANQLLHKRNEVLAVEKQDGEINPALYFDSDDERLALLAKQCDALQQTVSSLEGTLMLRVKELNETYEDLDTNRSDLRVAEVARIEAEAQLDVNKREVSRLQTVNEGFAEEIKHKIAENGKLEQDNRHLNESIESLQLEYDDNKARVSRLENALLAQEKGLEAIKNSEKSAKGELTNIEKELELTHQKLRKKEEECRKFKKEVDKAKKGSSMYNLCNVLKPGETLELVSVDLPSITSQIPRGITLKEGPHGVYIDNIEANSSAGKTHRLISGDRVVEINLNDVSNAVFDVVRREIESVRAMQLVVARVAPDVRVESKLRADALKDQIKAMVIDLDKTTKHCQELQAEAAQLKDDMAGLKAKQKSEINSRDNMKMAEELQNLKALLAQKDQYMKTLETTVKSKNELLVTLEMDSHRTPRSTPNSSVHQSSFSPGLSSSMRDLRSPTSSKGKESKESTPENINR